MVSTRVVLAITSAAVALAGGLATAVPAQAAKGDSIDSGRAIIRIDAKRAQAAKVGDNSYRVTLPADSSGYWLGERTDAQGRERVGTGDLTADQLAQAWTKFRYTSAPVLATVVWNGRSKSMGAALVKLSQPKATDAGVEFTFTSPRSIPGSLKDMSINIRRAPMSGKGTRTNTPPNKAQIYGTTWEGAINGTSSSVNALIYTDVDNSGNPPANGNYCWNAQVTSGHPDVSLGNGITCGAGTPSQVTFTNHNTAFPAGAEGDFTHHWVIIDSIIAIPGHATSPYTQALGW